MFIKLAAMLLKRVVKVGYEALGQHNVCALFIHSSGNVDMFARHGQDISEVRETLFQVE
jgi:hypothetical protein